MKILIDHQIFCIQQYGGISRYFNVLMKTNDNLEVENTTVFTNNYYLNLDKLKKYISFFFKNNFRGKRHILNYLNKYFSIAKIKKGKFDIFHPTYYDPYFLKYLNDKPFVLTVHDMTHEKLSEFCPKNDKTSSNKKILAHKASKIIAVSNSTKNDLIEIFGIEESKIEVIYHGNSMLLNDSLNSGINFPSNYLLFVGIRGGYKNFTLFIESISKLLNEDLSLSVVCAGGGKFNKKEKTLFKKLNIQSSVFQYDLNDNLLAQLYTKAIAFVFPSLYEGFGIPILESFACNCPLICSNTSSLPEIASDGAEYFDPYSKESIYQVVKKVIENKNIRNSIIKKGKERLKYFSWAKTALETKKIYEDILK